jgi:hypothetical protein
MGEDSKDNFRAARELFEQSRETFYEAHVRGMETLNDSTGRVQAEQFGDAVEQKRRAIEQMREAIELQRVAIAERGGSFGQTKEEEGFTAS